MGCNELSLPPRNGDVCIDCCRKKRSRRPKLPGLTTQAEQLRGYDEVTHKVAGEKESIFGTSLHKHKEEKEALLLWPRRLSQHSSENIGLVYKYVAATEVDQSVFCLQEKSGQPRSV
jgi:hypothetical protein